jgi:hypothetical protein
VDAAVQAQQAPETPLVKGFHHNPGTMKGFLPVDYKLRTTSFFKEEPGTLARKA